MCELYDGVKTMSEEQIDKLEDEQRSYLKQIDVV